MASRRAASSITAAARSTSPRAARASDESTQEPVGGQNPHPALDEVPLAFERHLPQSKVCCNFFCLRAKKDEAWCFDRGEGRDRRRRPRPAEHDGQHRITAAITCFHQGERPIKAVLDPFNPTGSTLHVNFTTSKRTRWQTDPRRCHLNWVVCDGDWEAELCRVVEAHPRVLAYVKNQALGFEVPYRQGSLARRYRPDFIVLVDDGRGPDDPLHLVVEIKGYRGEDAKEKKSTMETYWVPGVNHLGAYGRWAFSELTQVYEIESEFAARVEAEVAAATIAVERKSA